MVQGPRIIINNHLNNREESEKLTCRSTFEYNTER
jgi:hypothetical protein